MRRILDQLRAPHGIALAAVAGMVIWGRLVPDERKEGAEAPSSSRSSPHSVTTPDGRFVVFQTGDDLLIADDRNKRVDVLLGDRVQKTITLVSTDSQSRPGNGDSMTPSISHDGRFIAFRSTATNLVVGDTNDVADIFVKDMKTGVTILVSTDPSGQPADSYSSRPVISPDGRFVTFKSWSTNLVADDTNGLPDQFTRDLTTGKITRVSPRAADEP
jgi:Tol biopolymer transport system component